jgi:citrate lyase gamma subunit
MASNIKLRVNDLKKLMSWISTLEDKDYEVEIITSNESGIGMSIEASIEVKEGQGIWIDLTDYENW